LASLVQIQESGLVDPKKPRGPAVLRDLEQDRTRRVVFGKGVGCTIYAWPSTGGVVIGYDADIVDLKYLDLGLARSDPGTNPTKIWKLKMLLHVS
jgi:hypothetical protein